MVIIRVKGGMGNQLFQYALYRKYQIMGKKAAVDLQYYKSAKEERAFREYELPLIGLQPEQAQKEDIVKLAGKESILNKAVRRMGLRKSYIREPDLSYHSEILHKENVYLNGYWQCDKYFKDIRQVLLDEIQYPLDRKQINDQLYKRICTTQSVCVTIRRGDYVSESRFRDRYYVCDASYFEKGMKKVQNILGDVTFFAFSDDIEWVKENVEFPGPVFFERGDDPIYEKMRLMSSCKHFIISNSSFSWWVQYLSTYSDKCVFAPRNWYADGTKTDIYQDNWIYV